MSLKCVIELENPLPYFYSGQLVRGFVSMTLEQQEKFQDLTFLVKGETCCKWTEKESLGKKDEKIVEYVGLEDYFKTTQSLFTAEYTRQDDLVIVNPGNHTFPFAFTLLSQLPSSFEGPYGSVRYSIQVITKRPYKINDMFNRVLNVIHHTDLNLNPGLSTPVIMDTNKSLYFLFSNQGTLAMSVELPQSGFIPGQDINIRCMTDNKSKVSVLEIVTSFQKITTYNVTTPKKKNRVETEKLIRTSRKGPEKGETLAVNYSVTIPQTLPSTIIGCLINIKYLLKVKAVMSGIHTDLVLEMPITVGTVPIRTPNQPMSPGTGEKEAPPRSNSPDMLTFPLQTQQLFPEPPPSYEESMRTPNPGPPNPGPPNPGPPNPGPSNSLYPKLF